jgi:hypothetical protein
MNLCERIGVSEEGLQQYLAMCDEVVRVPGGHFVRRGNVLHIFAPQGGLSGRGLVKSVKAAVDKFHRSERRLTCPVKKSNQTALRFVEFFGFKPYAETDSHVWFQHFSGETP